jgi:hypothetical protein
MISSQFRHSPVTTRESIGIEGNERDRSHQFGFDAGLVAVMSLSVGAYVTRRGEPLPEVMAAAVSPRERVFGAPSTNVG